MTLEKYPWSCPYCPKKGFAETRVKARIARKVHLDVGRLIDPQRHPGGKKK